jgi:3-oxoacyl-ACP reductase-like protein
MRGEDDAPANHHSLSTREVLEAGGEKVVVTGDNFSRASRVFFDDVYHHKYDAQFTVDNDH